MGDNVYHKVCKCVSHRICVQLQKSEHCSCVSLRQYLIYSLQGDIILIKQLIKKGETGTCYKTQILRDCFKNPS